MHSPEKSLDPALLAFFPADTAMGSPEYNRIAARHAMIDFFAKQDPSCVDRYFTSPYINHNMRAPDGLEPVHDLAQRATSWKGVHTIIPRALVDGDLVLLHSLYSNLLGIAGQRVAFDLFRFKDGKIVEHWDALENAVAPDESGLSLIEGSVDIVDLSAGEANRATVTRFVETILVGGNTGLSGQFVDTGRYVPHSPHREPWLTRRHGVFVATDEAPKVTYLTFHKTIAEGNFVLVQGEGRIGDTQVLEIYDLFRLQSGKIVEHWDVLQPLAPREQWANASGPF